MTAVDFSFHWEGALGQDFELLHVVEFEARDAMSHPYEVSLLLHARAGTDDLDPYDLVGQLATLRVHTGSTPRFRALHGLIISAEDRGSWQGGSLYHVVMMPPLARAMHRRRSRVFHEKTTRQIVEAVLKGEPRMMSADSDGSHPSDLTAPFTPPRESFVWRVSDTRRLDDLKARHYTVQYEESDFDFVARLLEEEGIAYHFEHTDAQVVLVMSDSDVGRARLEPFEPLGPETTGRQLGKMRAGGRLRPTKVRLLEYNWQKPKLDMGAEATTQSDDLFVHAYPGRHREGPDGVHRSRKRSWSAFRRKLVTPAPRGRVGSWALARFSGSSSPWIDTRESTS